jgi:hypothetical protein
VGVGALAPPPQPPIPNPQSPKYLFYSVIYYLNNLEYFDYLNLRKKYK